MKNIYMLYSIVDATAEYTASVEAYAKTYEAKGAAVFLKHRDCNLEQDGLLILDQCVAALKSANEVHVFAPCDSKANSGEFPSEYVLDMGMIIFSGKPVKLIYPDESYEFDSLAEALCDRHATYFMTPAERVKAAARRVREKIYAKSDVPMTDIGDDDAAWLREYDPKTGAEIDVNDRGN